MRVHGLLSFFDEPLEFLWDFVKSFHQHIDTLIAVDGAYAAFPWQEYGREEELDGTTGSPAQKMLLQGACYHFDVPLTYHRPEAPWEGNEIEKRTRLFEMGQAASKPGDWFWVLDADEELDHIEPDWRPKLARTDLAVASIAELIDGPPVQSVPAEVRMLYRRWDEGPIRVGTYHCQYLSPTDEKLWTGQQTGDVPHLGLEGCIWHKALKRPSLRGQKRLDYYNRANMLQLDRYM